MDWIEVAVKTTTEGIEPVSGILIMNGISGYAVEDSADFEEFLRDKEVYWDYIEDSLMALKDCDTVVTFYITDDLNHLPVRLDMYLNFGSAKAFLSDIKGNRYPLTSIVKTK